MIEENPAFSDRPVPSVAHAPNERWATGLCALKLSTNAFCVGFPGGIRVN